LRGKSECAETACGLAPGRRPLGFQYITMAFDWMKLNGGGTPFVGISYRTRANTEGCLLFTTGRNATPERKPGCLSGGFLIPSNHLDSMDPS
jgi:hypothetical protein